MGREPKLHPFAIQPIRQFAYTKGKVVIVFALACSNNRICDITSEIHASITHASVATYGRSCIESIRAQPEWNL